MLLEMRLIFKGKVQGVGFRWTVVEQAERFSLTGTVQNLPNGTVEAYAQGTQEALEAFIAAIQKAAEAPEGAHIDSLIRSSLKPLTQPRLPNFTIVK